MCNMYHYTMVLCSCILKYCIRTYIFLNITICLFYYQLPSNSWQSLNTHWAKSLSVEVIRTHQDLASDQFCEITIFTTTICFENIIYLVFRPPCLHSKTTYSNVHVTQFARNHPSLPVSSCVCFCCGLDKKCKYYTRKPS